MLNYQPTLVRDPVFAGFAPDYGQYASMLGIALCDRIERVVFSVVGCNRLIGAVVAAPSKTPVPAIEELLVDEVGDEAFDDDAKKLTGRLVRQALEHIGGKWIRPGAKAPSASRYNRGSVYSFE